jgi:uncharacterized membrane protein YczE
MTSQEQDCSEWRSAWFVVGCALIGVGCGLGFLIDASSPPRIDSMLGLNRAHMTWLTIGLILVGFIIAVFAPHRRS